MCSLKSIDASSPSKQFTSSPGRWWYKIILTLEPIRFGIRVELFS